jgi:hypothetical protein
MGWLKKMYTITYGGNKWATKQTNQR